MPRFNGRRVAVDQSVQMQAQNVTFTQPIGGWVTATNPAMAAPGTAKVCENWFPASTGLRARAGSIIHGTASGVSLESLMTYIGFGSRRMFAGSGGSIYDLTLPVDPNVAPTPVVTGQTSNYYSFANFATIGGNYLIAVNGTDSLRMYDGAAWTAITGVSTPAITGVVTSTLSQVNPYRNRLWFVEKDSLNAHYLPVDSIAGAASVFTLFGTFKRGGSLLFIATWSMDSGDGMDDKIVFASTEGEFAVFQGSVPGMDDWTMVGRYDASPPLGKNAFTQVGGDLLVLTEVGIVPMSAIQTKAPSFLSLSAVSKAIQPDWVRDVQERRALPWEIVKWASQNVAYISCPTTNANKRWCYAVNLETGAWAKYTSWDTQCLTEHDGGIYFGTSDGKLMRAELSGFDRGMPIYHKYVGHPESLGAPGVHKTLIQARAISRVSYAIDLKISFGTNYSDDIDSPPNVSTSPQVIDTWDNGKWDEAKWDNGIEPFTVSTGWVSVGKSGYTHSLQIQLTSGQSSPPRAELVTVEGTFEVGGLVI